MTTPSSASGSTLEALPNPRGGAVRAAESALADAISAHEQHRDAALFVLHTAHALREAGWLAAHRFADALVLASPLAFDATHATHASDATGSVHPVHSASAPAAESPVRTEFGAALHAFAAALGRRNLHELSCSPSLYVHYRALSTLIAQHTPGFTVAFEDVALAGRPVPPAMLHTQSAQRLAHIRARYEQALLPVLRAQTGDGVMSAATLVVKAALDELEACIGELTGPDPYDFWRLAGGCARALRVSGHLSGDADTRRFFARCNLALADQARGIAFAPRSLVRTTLALLWRDYALFGAAAEDTDHVELLRDYGLTVVWHVAGTSASEALWEAQAAGAGHAHPPGTAESLRTSSFTDTAATPSDALQARPSTTHLPTHLPTQSAATRELGAVTVNANAYEDFLQTADASIAALSEHARAADNPQRADPSAALQAGDAAYRLGASASALGLGHVALLSDALGLAWRRRAHAAAAKPDGRTLVRIDAPDAAALEHAALALRAMLHQIAAGIAPPQSGGALAALTRAIELGGAAS
ncbi:hypothetical protein [Paraburkholderia rhizosphaerae]|uniref:Scaffold protein FimL second domain-containing protein n=1 Tax=Paraburkholderia rhizosphaerae TaxID=480658 RepID=A0A4V3HDT9_9BURK|nr:hypothetical protein [Paraburkholderia rhizosphaerae]TDY42304.1 hypothetical protein BX592_122113 [Paraburkholderia rhizosphaerae]